MKKNIFLIFCMLSFSLLNAKTEMAPKKENSLRIMCYNVRNCKGMDDVTDFQRVADIMNQVAPDVVAVQELDSATLRSNGVFVLEELTKRTQMHWTYGAAIDYQEGKYGIGILSKEKPIRYETIALPGREEQRLLLIAEFQSYVLCCTHFSLTDEDRQASVPIIFEAIQKIQKPLFLAGDMNCVFDSPTQIALREKLITLNDPQIPTSPSILPKKCIDYIYGYDNGNTYFILQQNVLSDENIASDHLPLFVDIQVNK